MANIASGFILLRIFHRRSCSAISGEVCTHQLRWMKSGVCRTLRSATSTVALRGTTSPNSPGMNHRTPSRSSSSATAYSVPW